MAGGWWLVAGGWWLVAGGVVTGLSNNSANLEHTGCK